jgi:uncharacterized protein YegP (UPF0339 family)
MATATKKARTNKAAAASSKSKSNSMEFLIFEDNAGEYHWTLFDSAGDSLARSPSFASYEQAERAAHVVHDGAGSARIEIAPDPGTGP